MPEARAVMQEGYGSHTAAVADTKRCALLLMARLADPRSRCMLEQGGAHVALPLLMSVSHGS